MTDQKHRINYPKDEPEDEDKTFENEINIKQKSYIKNQNQSIESLKKDIDRLEEEYDNFKIISAGHQKLNGELRIENNELKERIKQLEDPLNKFRKEGKV